jgi:glycosyltransferase involved in cell wall biosynthesis
MTKPLVVYWNTQPSPYFVDRLNAVVRRGNIDIEAWFNVVRTPERSWHVNENQWLFRARYIPQRSFLGRPLNLPFAELNAARPDVFISLYDRSHFVLGSIAARACAQRTAYRVLPNYDTWSKRTWWREISKHILFRALDGAKVPGPEGRKLTMKYGLPEERSYKVQQTVDVEHFASARAMPAEERAKRQAALGLKGCVFIYVGRLWSGKGLTYLIEAFRKVQAQQPDVSLLLVGDGVEEREYREMVADLPQVAFTGFIQTTELPQYYALADVMIFPTLGDPHGLVAEEAMAAGVPVICTENAGDIRLRLPDNEAGFIVPPADSVTLADRMLRLAQDPALRQRFVVRATEIVKPQSPDAYARDFEAFIQGILSRPARQTPFAYIMRGVGQVLLRTSGSQIPAAYVPIQQERSYEVAAR